MNRALEAFIRSIQDARSLASLYQFLRSTMPSPFPYDDLLRTQLVYSISAFDKLIHELVRLGMVEIYVGVRISTPKFRSEAISMELHTSLINATLPPKQVIFEQEIARKLKQFSFQDPDKVADGLSYIWDENQKWMKIAAPMKLTADEARRKLKIIVNRRNAIVHESDSDPLSHTKRVITPDECAEVTDFIEACGLTIVNLITLDKITNTSI